MDIFKADEIHDIIEMRMVEWTRKAKELEQQKGGKAKRGAQAVTSVEETKIEINTPEGEKKDTTVELPKNYDPRFVENAWYSWWKQKGLFTANNQNVINGTKPPYVMMLPPPNVKIKTSL